MRYWLVACLLLTKCRKGIVARLQGATKPKVTSNQSGMVCRLVARFIYLRTAIPFSVWSTLCNADGHMLWLAKIGIDCEIGYHYFFFFSFVFANIEWSHRYDDEIGYLICVNIKCSRYDRCRRTPFWCRHCHSSQLLAMWMRLVDLDFCKNNDRKRLSANFYANYSNRIRLGDCSEYAVYYRMLISVWSPSIKNNRI